MSTSKDTLDTLRDELRHIDPKITVKSSKGKIVVTLPDDDAAWGVYGCVSNGWA